jgi:sulfide:quinone oxidoreductase
MELKQVTDDFAVAPQIAVEDAAALAQDGFVAVICNRPEAEEEGQPAMDAIRASLQDAGIAFHHLPVTGGVFPQAAVDAFRAVRLGTKGKVLGYCRTGTRAITLETLANPHGLSAAQRLENASGAGYDLSALAERIAD